MLLLILNQPEVTGTPSLSPSASVSPSTSTSPSASRSPSASVSPSVSPSSSLSPSASSSASLSPSASASRSPSASTSPSASNSPSASISPSASRSPSASASPSTAFSLISNYSFETGTTGWGLDGDFTRVNTDSYDGSWSIKQVSTGGYANFTTTNDSGSGIVLEAGRDYTLEFYAKIAVTSGLVPQFAINTGSAYGTALASVTLAATSGAWQKFAVTFNSGAHTKVWLRLYNNGGTITAHYDDFRFFPVVDASSPSASRSPSASTSASPSPSAEGGNVYLNFRRSVDMMKKMKDSVNSQITTEEKNALVTAAADAYANYVAFSVPLATQAQMVAAGNTPSPRTIEGEWLDWTTAIHNRGLGVIFRPAFPGMEGIYGFLKNTGVNRIPAGTLAAVLAGDTTETWCKITYDFIVSNAQCFNDTGDNPDVFALAPERTENSSTSRNITSITRVGQTATITTTTNHDMGSRDIVKIAGSLQSQYNGSFIATRVNSTQFTIQVTGSPTTPATGGMSMSYGYNIYDDALSPFVSTGSGIQANFREFYRQLNLTIQQACIDIGKPNVIVYDSAQNYSEVRSGWIPQTYFDDANRVAFDYYLNYNGGGFTAEQAMTDALAVYTSKGNKRIAWQEYGPIQTYGQSDAARAADLQLFVDEMWDQLVSTGKQEEMNFWTWWEGQDTSFLTKTGSGASSVYSLNPMGEVMKAFYVRIYEAINGPALPSTSPSASRSPSSSTSSSPSSSESPSIVSSRSPSASTSPSTSISASPSASASASPSPSPVWTFRRKNPL